jgi:hypothetical protein
MILTFRSQDGLNEGYIEKLPHPYFPYRLVFTKQSGQHSKASPYRSLRAALFFAKYSAGDDAEIVYLNQN